MPKDFRSEDGLYALVQAQYDAAATQPDAPSEPLLADRDDSCPSSDERPPKRRRVTRDQFDRSGGDAGEAAMSSQVSVSAWQPRDPASTENAISPEDGTGPFGPHPRSEQGALVSSPPATAVDGFHVLPDPERIDPRFATSSPLSSPPPDLVDPYITYITSSGQVPSSPSPSSRQPNRSRSGSEAPSSVSTPVLTAQSSFTSSGRLPNLKGKDLFDAQIWSDTLKTSVFYTFITSLRQRSREAEPTSTHRFLATLRDQRKLVRCYTQNIDQLEEKAGLSTSLNLGAGTRYRFSTRVPRLPGGGRGLPKKPEPSPQDLSGHAGRRKQGEARAKQEGQQDSVTPDESEAEREIASSQGTLEEPKDKRIRDDTVQGQPGDPSEPPPPGSQANSTQEAAPSPNRGVECVCLHGSLSELRCFQCARTASWDEDERETDTLAGRQPFCPHCVGATTARQERGKRATGVGMLRPDIVLYGEENPNDHLISPILQHDLSLNPDLLLIMGTSLRVHGLKFVVKDFARAVHHKGGKVVFVNHTKPPDSVWSDVIDYWVGFDCDEWVADLQRRKPALWLPLGTVPDNDETKSTKAPRRDPKRDGPSRRRDGGPKPKAKPECATRDGIVVHADPLEEPKREDGSGRPGTEMTAGLDGTSKANHGGVAGPGKRRKPAATTRLRPLRDHRQNGAYLSWKILHDLARYAGRLPPPDTVTPASSLQTFGAKAKKVRTVKSARVGLVGTLDVKRHPTSAAAAVDKTSKPSQSPRAHAVAESAAPLPDCHPDGSITSMVKSRRRKLRVWGVVNGVEMLIPLDRVAGRADQPLEKKQVGGKAGRTRTGKAKRLPETPQPASCPDTTVTRMPSVSSPASRQIEEKGLESRPREKVTGLAPVNNPDELPGPAFPLAIDGRAATPSRPSTPATLAPLLQHAVPAAQSPRKLQTLEPKLASPPGPNDSLITLSPVEARPHSSTRTYESFFGLCDPTLRHFPTGWDANFGGAEKGLCPGHGHGPRGPPTSRLSFQRQGWSHEPGPGTAAAGG